MQPWSKALQHLAGTHREHSCAPRLALPEAYCTPALPAAQTNPLKYFERKEVLKLEDTWVA